MKLLLLVLLSLLETYTMIKYRTFLVKNAYEMISVFCLYQLTSDFQANKFQQIVLFN